MSYGPFTYRTSTYVKVFSFDARRRTSTYVDVRCVNATLVFYGALEICFSFNVLTAKSIVLYAAGARW